MMVDPVGFCCMTTPDFRQTQPIIARLSLLHAGQNGPTICSSGAVGMPTGEQRSRSGRCWKEAEKGQATGVQAASVAVASIASTKAHPCWSRRWSRTRKFCIQHPAVMSILRVITSIMWCCGLRRAISSRFKASGSALDASWFVARGHSDASLSLANLVRRLHATSRTDHAGDGRIDGWSRRCSEQPGSQLHIVRADGRRFCQPPDDHHLRGVLPGHPQLQVGRAPPAHKRGGGRGMLICSVMQTALPLAATD